MVHVPCMLDDITLQTHSELVVLTAFAWQQVLCKHASMLHTTYTACLVLTELHHRIGTKISLGKNAT
jgi:hypothetical protein